MGSDYTIRLPIILYLLLLLAPQYFALKCYTGDSVTGLQERETKATDALCSRYDIPCWPGNIDPLCKQLNPKNLTYITVFTAITESTCRQMVPPSYTKVFCCKEDLCNTPVVEQPNPNPNPNPAAPTKQNSPASTVENKNVIYYVVGGAVIAILATGIIIFAIFKKRNTTDPLSRVPEEQQALLQDESNNFEEIGELGRGSDSVVMAVQNKLDGQKWALKKTLNKAHIKEEYAILRRLHHTNILKVGPIIESGLLLELCDCSLESKFESKSKDEPGTLSADVEVYDYILQLGRALEYLYTRKQVVLHCDIKPSNILLLKQGPKTILKLCDFGLAKTLDEEDGSVLDTSDKLINENIWTPNEVAKEKKYSISTDLFSFGVVCGQMLLRRMEQNMDEFRAAIEDIADSVKSEKMSKEIAKFILLVTGEQDKRPKGGDAKTRLVNFISNLDINMTCSAERNELHSETLQVLTTNNRN